MSKEGTAALAATAFSPDGNFFVYGISVAGSDSFTIYVRKATEPFRQEGNDQPEHHASDTLRYIKFSSIEWTYDNKGFFYQVSGYIAWRLLLPWFSVFQRESHTERSIPAKRVPKPTRI